MHRDPMATAAQWRAKAEAEKLSIRELIIEVTGRQSFIGSPATVAAQINDLVQADASDGFILVPHITPGGLDEFADTVVPMLQERGVFRTEYEGSTLREHLGLAPLALGGTADAQPGGVMKFLAITLIVHAPDPITGVQKSTTDRFREVIGNALLAEELGFDGFGVGERHERPFISSSPPVVLSHIAALTSRIRLFTAVTTLSLLDPVRAYEDYATLDHLSGGRLELIIGKGNGAAQRELFSVTPEDQWDRNAESYEMFRQIWRQPDGDRDAAVPAAAARCRGLAPAAAAADPDLARQRDQQGVRRPRGPLRRPAVLRQRHQPDRAVRRAGPLLPRAVGALRPRPGRPGGRRGHGRLLRRPQLPGRARGVPADLRPRSARSSSGSACSRSSPTSTTSSPAAPR